MTPNDPNSDPKQGTPDEADDLNQRFPVPPTVGTAPETPKLVRRDLPPHPEKPRQGAIEPGAYTNMGLAATAATSFIMPIIVCGLFGLYVLDARFHLAPWGTVGGFTLGFIVGIMSLMRVVNRMSQ